MEKRRLLRILVTGLALVAMPVFYLNIENTAIRLGYDKIIADAVVPAKDTKPSPVVQALQSPEAFDLALLVAGLFIGVWLDYFARRFDSRRNEAPWWSGLQSFTIKQFSSLVAGIPPSSFETSERAQAIAGEIRGYVNSGHMPTMLELPEEKSRIQDYGGPRYALKNVADNIQILRSDLERLAISRRWKLPWEPQERKEPKRTVSRMLPNALLPVRHNGSE